MSGRLVPMQQPVLNCLLSFQHIQRTLNRIQTNGATVTLIAPVWKVAPWCSLLLSMLIDVPILIEHCVDLFARDGERPKEDDENVEGRPWTWMAAWRISGDVRAVQKYQKRLAKQWKDNQTGPRRVMLPPVDPFAGIVNEVRIPFEDCITVRTACQPLGARGEDVFPVTSEDVPAAGPAPGPESTGKGTDGAEESTSQRRRQRRKECRNATPTTTATTDSFVANDDGSGIPMPDRIVVEATPADHQVIDADNKEEWHDAVETQTEGEKEVQNEGKIITKLTAGSPRAAGAGSGQDAIPGSLDLRQEAPAGWETGGGARNKRWELRVTWFDAGEAFLSETSLQTLKEDRPTLFDETGSDTDELGGPRPEQTRILQQNLPIRDQVSEETWERCNAAGNGNGNGRDDEEREVRLGSGGDSEIEVDRRDVLEALRAAKPGTPANAGFTGRQKKRQTWRNKCRAAGFPRASRRLTFEQRLRDYAAVRRRIWTEDGATSEPQKLFTLTLAPDGDLERFDPVAPTLHIKCKNVRIVRVAPHPRANNPETPAKRVRFRVWKEEEGRAAKVAARAPEGDEGRRREEGGRAAARGACSEEEGLGGGHSDEGDEEELPPLDARAPWAEALALLRAENQDLRSELLAQRRTMDAQTHL
ncbi:hypothetical protein HK104_003064, partial [Borealophlyctis nickersoniae]